MSPAAEKAVEAIGLAANIKIYGSAILLGMYVLVATAWLIYLAIHGRRAKQKRRAKEDKGK